MKNKKQFFKEVYEQSKDKIYRLCLGFMGNNQDADDLFQEILIKVWNNLDSFRNESKIDTWIYRITTNTALMTLNKTNKLKENQKKYEPITIETNTDKVHSETNDLEMNVKNLYKAISCLKEIDRLVIGLLLENCSYKEIAGITGLKTSNVGVKINRIKKILTKKLK